MARLIQFKHGHRTVGCIASYGDLTSDLRESFKKLVQELCSDYDRCSAAQDVISELDLDGLLKYRFNTDVLAVDATLRYSVSCEVPYDEYEVMRKHAELMGFYTA